MRRGKGLHQPGLLCGALALALVAGCVGGDDGGVPDPTDQLDVLKDGSAVKMWTTTAQLPACGTSSQAQDFTSGRYNVHRYRTTIPAGDPVTVRYTRTSGDYSPILVIYDSADELLFNGVTQSGDRRVTLTSVTSGFQEGVAEVLIETPQALEVEIYVTSWEFIMVEREDPPRDARYQLLMEQVCDAPADADADSDVDADGDADTDTDADGDGDPVGPPGSATNPIIVDSFPFRHDGDTTGGDDLIDGYDCAPSTSEAGPEVYYRVTLSSPAVLVAQITESSGHDVDVQVMSGVEPAHCLERHDTRAEVGLQAGTYTVVVDTFRGPAGTELPGPYRIDFTLGSGSPRSLGTMWNTYYYFVDEAEYSGAQTVPIYDASCRQLGTVRQEFHDDVCIEGSGRLEDGTVINYASTCTSSCTAARRCGSNSYRICWETLDPTRYPLGRGSGDVALQQDYSLAVDPGFVPLGTVIYLQELDGIVPPGGTAPHDGCVRADDVGGAIDGNHFDFFVGPMSRYNAWEAIFPTRSNFTAQLDHPRCYAR